MHSVSFSLGNLITAGIALIIGAAVLKIVLHARKRWKEMDEGIGDAHARIDAMGTELKKFLPAEANLEFDPASTQNIDKRSVRERLGKKKTWIILGLACLGLVAAQFVIGSDADAPKDHARPGKHAKVVQTSGTEDKTEAPAAKADLCGKCKPDMPGGVIDTAKDGYVFADKCVGDGDCASCKPVGCVGENASAPPSCKTCSPDGK